MQRKVALLKAMTVLVLICASFAMAQNTVNKTGTTAAKFLSIPVGARAMAMGGAFVANADDATAAYWNPGLLNHLEKTELYLMHSEYLADIKLEYVSFAFPLADLGTVALSVTAMNMGEMLITTVDDPEGLDTGTFDAGSFAVGVSYSRRLTDAFSIGGTFKYVSENIWNSRATGIALDAGTIFRTPFKGIRLGVSIANFGTKMQISGDDLLVQQDIDPTIEGNNTSVNARLATDRFDLPLNLRIGAAYDAMQTDHSRLTLEVDGLHPNDNSESVSGGAELALLKERFFLRGGYRNLFQEDSENSYTAGFGLRYASESITFRIDYAYADQQHLQGIHQIGFALAF
ncbi:PorV/PorQ family protein [candidate division KSB1 bacterium]|nr:PorV/PorQ family protein [candidate division KSB1 bacterium]